MGEKTRHEKNGCTKNKTGMKPKRKNRAVSGHVACRRKRPKALAPQSINDSAARKTSGLSALFVTGRESGYRGLERARGKAAVPRDQHHHGCPLASIVWA